MNKNSNLTQIANNKSAFSITWFSHSERLRASGGGSGDRRDQSPFLHSPHGNPAFTPQKAGKASVASVSKKVWSSIQIWGNFSSVKNLLKCFFLAVGVTIAKATKASREAAYALHALLPKTMGQCEKHESWVEIVGNWKADWTCKENNESFWIHD